MNVINDVTTSGRRWVRIYFVISFIASVLSANALLALIEHFRDSS